MNGVIRGRYTQWRAPSVLNLLATVRPYTAPPPSPVGHPPNAAPDEAFLVGSVSVSSVDTLS
jgi:hypothetical protein